MSEKKILHSPGFAIVSRFDYSSATDRSHVERTSQYFLAPGEGMIFYGEEDKTSVALQFKQSEMVETLEKVPAGQLQLIAIVEIDTGSLLFTDGTPEKAYGINGSTPMEHKVMSVQLGRMIFAGIWGENKEAALRTLRVLQQMRLRQQ